jgi:2-C-methyl-D-erythritol 4-phosphate cytidylyltransferase
MIEWSLDAFRASESVGAIVVAVPPGQAAELGADVRAMAGGATRAHSVANALEAVETDLVAIHDAARPLLTPALVEDLVALLAGRPEAAGAIVAAPITDTIKQAEGSNCSFGLQDNPKAQLEVERTLDRSRLWAAQTPQMFRAATLREALEVDAEARDAATDEAMLVEAAGGRVLIHPTPSENLKVTNSLDLKLAELLLAARSAPE